MRRILILAITAVAAMAAMTGTAHAGVTDAAGNECDPCFVEDMAGEFDLMNSPTWKLGVCDVSFDFLIYYNGQLEAYNQDSTGCTGAVQRVPCTDNVTGESVPWPGSAVWIPGAGLKQKIDMCFEAPSNPAYHTWEEVTYTPNWDAEDYFDGFTQHGPSENGYIANAEFTNTGDTTEIKTDL